MHEYVYIGQKSSTMQRVLVFGRYGQRNEAHLWLMLSNSCPPPLCISASFCNFWGCALTWDENIIENKTLKELTTPQNIFQKQSKKFLNVFCDDFACLGSSMSISGMLKKSTKKNGQFIVCVAINSQPKGSNNDAHSQQPHEPRHFFQPLPNT